MNEVVLNYNLATVKRYVILFLLFTPILWIASFFMGKYIFSDWQGVLITIFTVFLSLGMTLAGIMYTQILLQRDRFFVRFSLTDMYFPRLRLKKDLRIDWKEIIAVSYDQAVGQLVITYKNTVDERHKHIYLTENPIYENSDFLAVFMFIQTQVQLAHPEYKVSASEKFYAIGEEVQQVTTKGFKDRRLYSIVVTAGIILIVLLNLFNGLGDFFQSPATQNGENALVIGNDQTESMPVTDLQAEKQEEPQFVSIRQKMDSGEDKEVLLLPIESSISVWNNKLYYPLEETTDTSVGRNYPILMSYDFSKDPASQPELVLDTAVVNAAKPYRKNENNWTIHTQIVDNLLSITFDGWLAQSYTYVKDLTNDSSPEYLIDENVVFVKTNQGYLGQSYGKTFSEHANGLIFYNFNPAEKKLQLILSTVRGVSDGNYLLGIDGENNFYTTAQITSMIDPNETGPNNIEFFYKNLVTVPRNNPKQLRVLIAEERMPPNITSIQYEPEKADKIMYLRSDDKKMFVYDIGTDDLKQTEYQDRSNDNGYEFELEKIGESGLTTIKDFVPPEGFSVVQL